MKYLRGAFNLLTALPVPPPQEWCPGDSGRAAAWYSAVGLVVGMLSAVVWLVSKAIFPPPVAGALTLTAETLLTGGLHLDGVADCADGLACPAPLAKRLEIMRDPRLGAFGGMALILILTLKLNILIALPPHLLGGILLATSLSRWCLLPAGRLPVLSTTGMGADFARGLHWSSLMWGGLLPAGLAIVLGWRGLLATVSGVFTMTAVLWLAWSRLRGITGDVLGLVVESVEVAVLLTFVGGTS